MLAATSINSSKVLLKKRPLVIIRKNALVSEFSFNLMKENI